MPNSKKLYCVDCVHFGRRYNIDSVEIKSAAVCNAWMTEPDPVYGERKPLMTASAAREVIGGKCKPSGLLFERKKNFSPVALAIAVLILIASYYLTL